MKRGNITVRTALMVVFVLIGLMQFSFWADRKSLEVEGPSRIIRGPKDTLYIQVDRKIAKVTSEGEVLHVLDLDRDAAIPEHIADFFVEDDGRLLIARRDSQLLQYFSPEGKLIRTHLRVPSPVVDGNHFCKFTKDLTTGTLYFADTSHHRIQIFGSNEKEVKTITVPSGVSLPKQEYPPKPGEYSEEGEDGEEPPESPGKALHYPNGLTFDQDRLIATDTGNSRIILFYPDGSLDRIITLASSDMFRYSNPLKVSRYDSKLYAVLRGPNLLTGKVAAFETSGDSRLFRYTQNLDPWDVMARKNDVLVADRASLSVLRYDHSGKLLAAFGKPSFQNLLADRQITKKIFDFFRWGSFGGMAVVFGWLLYSKRRERKEHELRGETLYMPISMAQNFLGPIDSPRRKFLLVMLPGLGQVAAGRILRAIILFSILCLFGITALFAWFSYSSGYKSIQIFITAILVLYSVWMGIILDGVHLNNVSSPAPTGLSCKSLFFSFTSPIVTVCTAIVIQFFAFKLLSNTDLLQALKSFINSIGLPGNPVSASDIYSLFGIAGAGAGMFSVLAWQARVARNKLLIAPMIGFFSGVISFALSAVITAKIGLIILNIIVHPMLLSCFVYLFLRRRGFPLLIVPLAVAAGWISQILFAIMAVFLLLFNIRLPSVFGTIGGIEIIAFTAYFIHLTVWTTWYLTNGRYGNDHQT